MMMRRISEPGWAGDDEQKKEAAAVFMANSSGVRRLLSVVLSTRFDIIATI